MPRDMSKAEFARALERYGIVQHGDGDNARFDTGSGIIPVRGIFGRQLPSNRRALLKQLIEDQEAGQQRRDRDQRRREHVWKVGDRAVTAAIGGRQYLIVIAPPNEEGRLRCIDIHGRCVSRDRSDMDPHTKGTWKGHKNLDAALDAWRDRELAHLRKVEAEIEYIRNSSNN